MPKILKMICHLLHIAAKTAKFGFFWLVQNSLQFGGWWRQCCNGCSFRCLRPYHVEYTSSRPITEVKQHWAELVLGWVTAQEYSVLQALCPFAEFTPSYNFFWSKLDFGHMVTKQTELNIYLENIPSGICPTCKSEYILMFHVQQ